MGCLASKDDEPKPESIIDAVRGGSVTALRKALKDPTLVSTIDVRAKDGATCLILAVERDMMDAATQLLTEMPPHYKPPSDLVNRRKTGDSTALHVAALRGYEHMVELLLSHGADPTLANDGGKTARDLTETNFNLQGMEERQRAVYAERAERKARIAARLQVAEQSWGK
eukprot:TRINITY_DN65202_c0_g1_i1.p1 TRINITY_DN65202_c0_g1~~TRINITY_DN65202_c0_g1_i1.p1  ORF type:complete len:170 (+),score=46.24 TRINITY_DN65202_c0_g1_i1:90-599(+)